MLMSLFDKDIEEPSEESRGFKRRFKYALIAFAVVEFIVTAFVVLYVARR